jgi:predicted transcriptional regulator
MRSGRKNPLTAVVSLIRGERHVAKELQRALGCTPRQAARIVDIGRVPQEYHARFVAFLKELRDRNNARVRAYDEGIRLFEYQRMVAEAKASRSETMGDDP